MTALTGPNFGRKSSASTPPNGHKSKTVSRALRSLVLIAMGFLTLLGWAVASPVGGSPDDNFHMTSIWCAAGYEEGICEPSDAAGERLVPQRVAYGSLCFAFEPEVSGVCGYSDTGLVSTGHGNFSGVYPPVFYGVMSLFVSENIDASVLAMRAFNAAIAVVLIGGLFAFAPSRLRGPLIWGTLASAIPMGVYLVASVNPSGWAFLSAATLWVAIVGFFTSPSTSRRIGLAAIAIVAAVLGAGSRGDSALFVAFGAVIACVLTFDRSRSWLLKATLPLLILVIGAWSYLSSAQVSAALEGEMAGEAPESVDVFNGLLRTIPLIQRLWVGNFGIQDLGWGDTPMPAIVWVTTTFIYSALVFFGVSGRLAWRKGLSLATIALALVFIPSWIIVQNQVAVGAIVQPRYVLPLIVIFAGVALFGSERLDLGLSFVQRWAVVLGLAGANSMALYSVLRRYLTGIEYNGLDLDADIEWWWSGFLLSPNAVWIGASLAFFTLLARLMASDSTGRKGARHLTSPSE